VTETFQVAGWRPSTPSRPGGLILAEHGEILGVATLAISDEQRTGLVELIQRYGQRHPTGSVTIPGGAEPVKRFETGGHDFF